MATRYDPLVIEKEILEFWEREKIFQKLMKKLEKSNKIFSFYEGPPTANNEFGVHHALGRTYKDIYLRYKAMKGFKQRRQGGFDAQGLWVEVEVEKALGLKSKHDIPKYGLEKFAQKCKERVEHFIWESWAPLSKKLGMWMDWKGAYITNSDHNNEYVWLFLKSAHDKGWLYKGLKGMPWCGRCGCSFAQHEVLMGYKEIDDESIYMKFPLSGKKNEFLLVWTTTPWTVSSNVAVAVNPDKYYVKVRIKDSYYYLSENRTEVLDGKYETEDKILGSNLIGAAYDMPYKDFGAQKDVKHIVIGWEEVSDEDGTGLVHIAPGCGPEDYELGQRERLHTVNPLNEDAVFLDGFGWQSGKGAHEVNKEAIEDLDKKGFLYKKETYKHNYPHCWRCQSPLVFRNIDQWFVKADEVQKKLKEKMPKDVVWQPSWVGTKRMMPWIKNMRDWAVSRTRYYGSAIPIWECQKCDKYEVIGSLKELKEKAVSGIDQLKELHRPWIDNVYLKCECGGDMKRVEETGDVWMDAGVMPFSTLNYMTNKEYWKKWCPADLIVEMHEQIRGWFYAMAFIGITIADVIPYKNVLGHGMVLAEDGREMHKSWGNAIFAREALEKMGADPMRWYYSFADPASTIRFGYGPTDAAKRELNVIWNFANFVNLYVDLKNVEKPDKFELMDRWILSRLETAKKLSTQKLDTWNYHEAVAEIKKFLLDDLSRTYGQFIRTPLSVGTDSDKKRIGYVLYKCLSDGLKLLAPYVPFIAEKIYQDKLKNTEKVDSVHLFDWPEADESLIDWGLEKNIELAGQVITSVLAAREKIQRNVRWPIKKVYVVSIMDDVKKAVKSQENWIKEVTNCNEIEIVSEYIEGCEPDVKVDYTVVEERLGPEVAPEVVGLIVQKSPKSILNKITKTGRMKLELTNKKEVEVYRTDLVIDVKCPEEYFALSDKTYSIIILKEEDENMLASGFSREVKTKVQALRKKPGLVKENRIVLGIKVSEKVQDMLDLNLNSIKDKVGADEVDFGKEVNEHGDSFKVRGEKIEIGFDVK